MGRALTPRRELGHETSRVVGEELHGGGFPIRQAVEDFVGLA